jgi:hypothetical protein
MPIKERAAPGLLRLALFWQFLYPPGFRLGVSQLNDDLARGSKW